MSGTLLLSFLFAVLCSESNAYQPYQARIPNGDKVPNPCIPSAVWSGVGHENRAGGGPRNPFGLDFKANDVLWNRTVCEKDSDGDGLTNGQELGDPNCTWTEGTTPMFSTNLSHPGICEPLGSPLCSGKNSWLMNCNPEKLDCPAHNGSGIHCMHEKLNCPAINESGVQNYTMRFPFTPIPTKETTYICHRFTLPNDSVADIVALEPIVDNAEILHHMLIFACASEPKGYSADESFECGMTTGSSCLSLIGIWTVGIAGHCLYEKHGYRIGPGGFQYAVVQLHWNNHEHKVNLTDSSGMRIYYTTQLRPYRGQIALVGQTFLEIPPGQPEVTFTGTCVSACTKKLPQSIFITTIFLHMHTIGVSGVSRLLRNGNLLRILDNVTAYDYNSPTMTDFEDPVEVEPGDEIQVKCVYDSSNRNLTTYFGEATSDEMCFAFFSYYPLLESLIFCGQWKTISHCNAQGVVQFEACDINTFMTLIVLLPQTCAASCTATPCALIIEGMYATGCHNYPDVKSYIATFIPLHTTIFNKCTREWSPKPTTKPQCPVNESSGQSTSLGFGLVFTLMAYAACY